MEIFVVACIILSIWRNASINAYKWKEIFFRTAKQKFCGGRRIPFHQFPTANYFWLAFCFQIPENE